MRFHSMLVSSLVFAFLAGFVPAALADNFDGVYVGKSKLQGQNYQSSGARVSCKPEYDIKITIAGNRLTGENLSIGGKATGTVQPDGSYTASGGLGTLTQASSQGRVQGNVVRGTFTQMTNGATCTGTLEATRQP